MLSLATATKDLVNNDIQEKPIMIVPTRRKDIEQARLAAEQGSLKKKILKQFFINESFEKEFILAEKERILNEKYKLLNQREKLLEKRQLLLDERLAK